MCIDPVFDNQIGSWRLRVFDEQRIVPHAQAYYHVEIRLFICQNMRLKNRVANRFVRLFLLRNIYDTFVNCSNFS